MNQSIFPQYNDNVVIPQGATGLQAGTSVAQSTTGNYPQGVFSYAVPEASTPQAPQLKSGFKTSEFWVTMINSLVGMAVLLGYLTPEQADAFSQAVLDLVAAGVIIISTVLYLYSRISLKREAFKSSTEVTKLIEAMSKNNSSNYTGLYAK